MAEERLIDDDLNKDKKYKIRKNADGEDELYIDDSVEEKFEEDVNFVVPVFDAAEEVLSPEQLAAIEEEKRERAERRKKAQSLQLEGAKSKLAECDYDGAEQALIEAEGMNPYSGELWALKLKTYTKNFTDFQRADDCIDAAENISQYCSQEQKNVLAEQSAPLEQMKYALEERAAALHVEVEKGKAERRAVFLEDKKRSLIWFTATLVPFIACIAVAIAFASVMFARQDGLNLILTIVFAALAAVMFAATLFTAHKMWDAMKKLSLNEKNSSTQLGREYEETIANVKKLNTVLHSFKI